MAKAKKNPHPRFDLWERMQRPKTKKKLSREQAAAILVNTVMGERRRIYKILEGIADVQRCLLQTVEAQSKEIAWLKREAKARDFKRAGKSRKPKTN